MVNHPNRSKKLRFEILDWNNAKTGLVFDDYHAAALAAEARVAETGNLVKLWDARAQEVRECGPGGWGKHWHSNAAPTRKERLADAADAVQDRK